MRINLCEPTAKSKYIPLSFPVSHSGSIYAGLPLCLVVSVSTWAHVFCIHSACAGSWASNYQMGALIMVLMGAQHEKRLREKEGSTKSGADTADKL